MHRRPLTFAAALWGVIWSAACDTPPWREVKLEDNLSMRIHGQRPITRLPEVGTLAAVGTLALPDSLQGFFALSAPVILRAHGFPICRLVVADPVDRAVHIFTLSGSHHVSLYGGGREDALFGSGGGGLGSAEMLDSGTVVVSTTGSDRRLVFLTTSGAVQYTAPLPHRPSHQGALAYQVRLRPDSLLYEINRSSEGGLIDVLDWQGHTVREIGTRIRYNKTDVDLYLNRGDFAFAGDTLWFARRADARVLKFPLGQTSAEPAAVVEVPVFYRAELPVEWVSTSDGRIAARVQEHLRAFAVGPEGDFYFVQSTYWPSIHDVETSFFPRTLLTVVSPDGTLRRVFEPGVDIAALAAVEHSLFATVGEAGRVVVKIFKNPLSTQDTPTRCS